MTLPKEKEILYEGILSGQLEGKKMYQAIREQGIPEKDVARIACSYTYWRNKHRLNHPSRRWWVNAYLPYEIIEYLKNGRIANSREIIDNLQIATRHDFLRAIDILLMIGKIDRVRHLCQEHSIGTEWFYRLKEVQT